MSVSGSTTGKSSSGTRSTPAPSRLPVPADADVPMADSAEARGDDPGSDDEAVEGPPKFKVEKPDKYYGDRKKLEPWLLQLAVNFF